MVGQEFTDIYVLDLGSDVRRNPKISGTTHNVFGIQTGVAIAFFVREKAKLGRCDIHYARREDAEPATEKLDYLREATLDRVEFGGIMPDAKSYWLGQSNSGLEQLLALASRESKVSSNADERPSVFRMHSMAVATNRDLWVYDFDVGNLRAKAMFFADTYNDLLDRGDASYPTVIKWSRDLRNEFQRRRRILYNEANRIQSLYRPYVLKHHLADFTMNDVLTRNHYTMFGHDLGQANTVVNFCVNGKAFYALATDRLVDLHFTGDTQCLPLYRYTVDGERVSNITEWGLQHFREHYDDDSISAEDIFAYTYAMLHDPAYRQRYEVDLRREFPRVYFQKDFTWWTQQGRELLDLHLGFETHEPWPLERQDKAGVEPKRALLRADKEKGVIRLDDQTSLSGIPPEAWEYQLGSRSALEWVLDQYKERTPRDPTIRERFNTYRFADYKEHVIDLLGRICAVSTFTTTIVNELGATSSVQRDSI